MALTVEELILRLEKGSPLTAAEGDDNLKKLRDFGNALAALFSVALNNDGTLRNPPIVFGSSTAGSDAYVIAPTPAITSAADLIGRLIIFRADVPSNGPATLQINGLAAAPIVKFGSQPLENADIKGAQYVFCSWDGTNFQMQSWPGVVQPISYGGDTGAANAYVVTQSGINAIPAAYYAGLEITFKAANANTGPSTLQLGAVAPAPLRRPGGAALTGGEIVAGQIVKAIYDGANFQMNSLGSAGFEPIYTAATNLVTGFVGTVGWTTLDLAALVPAYPSFYRYVIVRVMGIAVETTAPRPYVEFRKSSSDPAVRVYEQFSNTGAADGINGASDVIIFPVTSARRFDYQVPTSFGVGGGGNDGVTITAIGYMV